MAGINTGGGGNAFLPGQVLSVERFDESHLSLSGSTYMKANQGLEIQDESTAYTNDPTDTLSTSEAWGQEISPNTDLEAVEATLYSGQEYVSRAVLTDTNGNLIAEDTSGFSGGDTVRFEASLSSGTKYWIGVDDGGNSYNATRYYDSLNAYPKESEYVDFTHGVKGIFTSDPMLEDTDDIVFQSVTAYPSGAATSGTVYIGLPYPDDILAGWGSVFYEANEDNETVDVFIEEDQNGWTEIAGPVSNGAEIEADKSNNVRFRVEFSRQDTSNNPRLTEIHRQEVFVSG